MNKQTRLVFFILVGLLVILAASTSFFATKTYKMGKSKTQTTATPSTSVGSGTSGTNATPTPVNSSQVTKPASSGSKPSKPTDTYTIQKGETLFSIAQAQGVSGTDLAEANGITDTDKIQAGQVLIVPKGGEIAFTVDATLSASLQKDVDNGKYQFRLSPEDTARSDAPTCYGLQVGDTFTLKSNEGGSAQVQATHENKNYIIKLTQPATKGDKGIWAIESIRPV